ncbi:serine/threonine-protein phosphatase [Streptomyces sp. F001]|uniref:PP2C family protein-serine/threonine phosphatase n=1 Tax=Streptomyces sp. F001 TaxID=1510026 RepID=UPI00101E3F58|nr:PP2C family protein-serine/threonine phosphatase [Streptomyces sp. F001]RZB20355.1 serine/threonine-protein phosphatase [Streptomyces sp. F001]
MIRNLRVSGRVVALGLPTMWGVLAVVFFAVGTGLVLHVRRTLLRELRQARKVAAAAQDALLRPMPPRIDGLNVAAAQLSADRGSSVGGDLYEVVATDHGVRVVMGDVRGHGLAAIGTVAAVLGSFREAVHDEPELAGVLRRLDRALARYLRGRADGLVAEEFVTVLLLEIGRDGELRALNCGHPWPYRLLGTHVEPLARADPLPPMGSFPLPPDLPAAPFGQLRPGEALFLFTDGAEDARDARGRFFPLEAALAEALRDNSLTPQSILGAVFTSLLCHTSGSPTDDIALLALRNERQPRRPSGARDSDTCGSAARARATTTHPHPTTHR